MATFGNILWLILGGIWMSILYFIAGVVALILIITIPFGLQAFKLAGFVLWPFGRSVITQPGASTLWTIVGNVVWVVIIGWWLALVHVGIALLFFITIIGIPFGVANLKFARLALIPFGMEVSGEPQPGDQVVVAVEPLGAPTPTPPAKPI